MNRIILYNPSITTLNIGDEIIFESVHKHIEPILENAFVINVSTHLPVSDLFARALTKADYKFVCGTNLLRNRLGGRFRQWDINIFNAKRLGPCVLVGVGWQKDGKSLSRYTKCLYKKILSKDVMHSVRDEYTKTQLEKMGFTNVINTGCATMWDLTEEKCNSITKKKSGKVIYTLTDYNRDEKMDKKVVDILCKEYEEVYLWIQGNDDEEYAEDLGILDRVTVIPPTLKAYDEVLEQNDVEYFGTRLHGGIRALQHGKRTMIIAVDGRALEKKRDFNLPVVERSALTYELIHSLIYDERATEINIPVENIKRWKKQFE